MFLCWEMMFRGENSFFRGEIWKSGVENWCSFAGNRNRVVRIDILCWELCWEFVLRTNHFCHDRTELRSPVPSLTRTHRMKGQQSAEKSLPLNLICWSSTLRVLWGFFDGSRSNRRVVAYDSGSARPWWSRGTITSAPERESWKVEHDKDQGRVYDNKIRRGLSLGSISKTYGCTFCNVIWVLIRLITKRKTKADVSTNITWVRGGNTCFCSMIASLASL